MSTTRERRWDIGEEFVMPKVRDIVLRGEVVRGEVARAPTRSDSASYDTVDAYYDTVDLDLAGAGVTVRRCDGAGNTRWLVDAPGFGGAIDIRAARSKAPPASITRLLHGVAHGRNLVDVTLVDETTADRLAMCRHVDDDEQPLTVYTRTQLDAIIAGDIALRRGEDPIHDTRVAIRRLRSTLRVFRRALVDDDEARRIARELKWISGLLGEVRDCQVQIFRFIRALNELPAELVLGPVRGDVTSKLLGSEVPARQRVADAMDSDRYLDMMAVLRRWRTEPPIIRDGDAHILHGCAKRARDKADRRLAQAVDARDDAALHRARKAAKRARYAAEAMSSAAPKSRWKVKEYKRIQSVLGDHQDTVVARELLRTMATASAARGRNGFTYGLLFEREHRQAQRCHERARELAAR